MFRVVVFLIALAVLFLLTTLAVAAGGHVRRPLRIGIALAAILVLAVEVLSD